MDLNFTKDIFPEENIFLFSIIASCFTTAVAVMIIARIFLGRNKMRATADLEEYKKMLAESDEEKNMLNAEIEALKNRGKPALMKFNHELRTSINAILGISNLLGETEITKKQNEYIRIINDSSNKCLALSNELLYVFDNRKIEVKSVEIKNEFIDKRTEMVISPDFADQIPLTILIAEDDKINRIIATKLLEKLGYQIDAVENGKEALEMVCRKNYDVILMDVHMPQMSGREAAKIIRQLLDVQPVIIAVTASIIPEEKRICLDSGMNDFITKPLHASDLATLLEKWFKKDIHSGNIISEKRIA